MKKIMMQAFVLFFFTSLLTAVGCDVGGGGSGGYGNSTYSQDDVFNARVFFQPAEKGEKGYGPHIALGDCGTVIQTHQSENYLTCWYRFGKVNNDNTLSWLTPGIQYDNGQDPSIAIAGKGVTPGILGYVMEIHESQHPPDLWYHSGWVDASGLHLRRSAQTGQGITPAITMNDGGFFATVHQSQNHSTLWYRLGTYDFHTGAVNWAGPVEYTNGCVPDIAMVRSTHPDVSGFLVEVHQSQNHDTLWYNVGRYNFQNGRIDWWSIGSQQYDRGVNPSVAVTNDGRVMEVHQGPGDDNNLWYHVGRLDFDNWVVDWGPSHCYDNGRMPSVAMNDDFLVQIHNSDNADHPHDFWASSALVADHTRWMEDLRSIIGDKALWEITVPGTHDAAMYMTQDVLIKEYSWIEPYMEEWIRDHWVHTQDESLWRQLIGGVRFFDLRPAYHGGQSYIYHSYAGPFAKAVFTEIGNFMQYCEQHQAGELVVVMLSHSYQYDAAGWAQLEQIIMDHVGPYLYLGDGDPDIKLLEKTFNEYTGGRGVSATPQPKVLVLLKKGDYDQWTNDTGAPPPPGIWPYQEMHADSAIEPVYGNMRIINDYANSDDAHHMENDQTAKMLQCGGGDKDRAFLLSWTLTAQDKSSWWIDRYLGKEPHSIHDFTRYVKRLLGPFLKTYYKDYKINIIYTDFYADYASPDVAILMNRGIY